MGGAAQLWRHLQRVVGDEALDEVQGDLHQRRLPRLYRLPQHLQQPCRRRHTAGTGEHRNSARLSLCSQILARGGGGTSGDADAS